MECALALICLATKETYENFQRADCKVVIHKVRHNLLKTLPPTFLYESMRVFATSLVRKNLVSVYPIPILLCVRTVTGPNVEVKRPEF